MKRFLLFSAALLLMPLQAMASDITIEGAWVRLPPPVADTAAAYMTIRNNGARNIEILDIDTTVAKKPEFHAMEMHGDMMHMQKMKKVIIPAGGGITFSPGGNHVMLVGLTGKLKAGEHILITLITSEDESVTVHAEVRDMRNQSNDTGNMNNGHSGHDMHGGMHH